MMPAARTVADLLLAVRTRLAEAGMREAALEARLLVEHFSGLSRTDAIRAPDTMVEPGVVAAVEEATSRRLAGEPVHRILGFREFYGLSLHLSPDTLEPRPDTEILVDAVLPFVRAVALHECCDVLDLGTGSGAIALAVLSQVVNSRAVGVDISPGALRTAADNAARLGLSERFETVRSDWFHALAGRYHLIVSNPPYIESGEIAALQPEVRDFDPPAALDGGPDGLAAYRLIAAGAGAFLNPGGLVAVEIGHRQKAAVTDLFASEGYALVQAATDLTGHDRALVFQKNAD